MSIKSIIRNLSRKNVFFSRQYDKLSWYKSRLAKLFVPDKTYAKYLYKQLLGKELNLDNPQTFDEKVWYLKLHNRDPLLTICSDKFKVREYVEQCGYGDILNELYGVYKKAKDIDFSSFDKPVFFKCNHCSGDNIIFYPDKPFDIDDFIKRFDFILKQNYYVKSREWNYKNIPPRIIAEKVLRDKDGRLPLDYKFLCFNGKPKILFLGISICTEEGKHADHVWRNVYDMDFTPVDMVETDKAKDLDTIKKPENFDKMVEIAAALSKPFIHCRVDLYNIDGKIYFGEITFYHGGGCNSIEPQEWDYRLGSWIDLDKLKE